MNAKTVKLTNGCVVLVRSYKGHSLFRMPCGERNGMRWVVTKGEPQWSSHTLNFVWADNLIRDAPDDTGRPQIVAFPSLTAARQWVDRSEAQ